MRKVAVVLLIGSAALMGARTSFDHRDHGSHGAILGYYCGNHSPSHYATTPTQVQHYRQKYGCSSWTAAHTGAFSGIVVDSSGSPVGGSVVTLTTAVSTPDENGTDSPDENGTLRRWVTSPSFVAVQSG
jgi:hypothetical protein